MKRVRLHRGLRHYWGIRVRGQHTKTTGRHRAFAAMEASKGKKWLAYLHRSFFCITMFEACMNKIDAGSHVC